MQQKGRVTVYDIAHELAISPSTVSRVLNNSVLVGEEKRRLILETAERLGYQKRRIRKQSQRAILNIAVVLPSGDDTSLHLFYAPSALFAGLEAGFEGVRVNVVTLLAGTERRLFDSKKLGDIDGCVFAFCEPAADVRVGLNEMGTPWLVINRVGSGFNYVANDNEAGMALLVGAITERRRDPRPLYLGFDPVPAVNTMRRDGFQDAVRRADVDGAGVMSVPSLKAIDGRLLDRIAADGHRAVVCFNDVVAVYFYQAALHAGLSVPGDFALTGFDASPVRELLSRKIDTVSLSTERLAVEAGRYLRDSIIERSAEKLSLLVEGEYIAGETI